MGAGDIQQKSITVLTAVKSTGLRAMQKLDVGRLELYTGERHYWRMMTTLTVKATDNAGKYGIW